MFCKLVHFRERVSRAVDELENWYSLVSTVSRFEPETSRTEVSTIIYLLAYLTDYICGQRKQYTFNTQGKITKN